MRTFTARLTGLLITAIICLGFSFSGPVSAQSNDSGDTNNKCRAFSLHSALSEAQDTPDPRLPRGLPGATKSKDVDAETAVQGFAGLLQRVINGLTGIAAAIAIFFIVFNAGGFMLAAGDMEKIKKARNGIIWALVGLLLIMFSYVIAKTAISLTYSGSSATEGHNTFNQDCPPEPGPTPASTVASNLAAETPAACEANFVENNLPDACYDGATDGSRQAGGQACNTDEVCVAMNLPAGCDMGAIQTELGAIPKGSGQSGVNIESGNYAGLGSKCSEADGKYGECTRRALEKYLSNKCGA